MATWYFCGQLLHGGIQDFQPRERSSSSVQACCPRSASPKPIQPMQTRETVMSDLPSFVYFMFKPPTVFCAFKSQFKRGLVLIRYPSLPHGIHLLFRHARVRVDAIDEGEEGVDKPFAPFSVHFRDKLPQKKPTVSSEAPKDFLNSVSRSGRELASISYRFMDNSLSSLG